ncbi:MAG: hypothetical protein H0U43_05380 [Chthoniobacterales bacterium]|nr:hypothetical protein [Chthoniobacterales bacterium]
MNRSPVTREWTADAATGTASRNQAVWIESSDSVGFSLGFTCTAFIPEENAAKFLYWYPSGSLTNVMDTELRGRVQQIAAEVAARYPLDDLRAKKQEIADAVRTDVTTFFALRGISVTTIGMFGGMSYENAEIQKSIDGTVIAQQLKVVHEARFAAQQRENDRIELEANATAGACAAHCLRRSRREEDHCQRGSAIAPRSEQSARRSAAESAALSIARARSGACASGPLERAVSDLLHGHGRCRAQPDATNAAGSTVVSPAKPDRLMRRSRGWNC